jgi:hypothetical protein
MSTYYEVYTTIKHRHCPGGKLKDRYMGFDQGLAKKTLDNLKDKGQWYWYRELNEKPDYIHWSNLHNLKIINEEKIK